MNTEDIRLRLDDTQDVVQMVMQKWNLYHKIKDEDEELLDIVRSAINDAYMTGCLHGCLDSKKLQEAIKFFSK